MARKLFTSESVSKGHPDKVSDQISDAVLDACLADDPQSRVACETLVTTGTVVIAGEITTGSFVDFQEVARETIRAIGYDRDALCFHADSAGVHVLIHEQSPDIAGGVDHADDDQAATGAGDQGMMFGYACTETESLMPFPIHYAHRLVEKLADLRESGALSWLRPDSKSQVTVEYEDDRPIRVHTVVISTQHDPQVNGHDADEAVREEIARELIEKCIKTTIPADMLDAETVYHINPSGKFVIGGPHGDCGLTGRKIIVDTYGGYAPHGGGAFSGKDPTKVDRSAAYASRWVAKNVVAAGLADRCQVQLAYAIGVAHPVSVRIDTFGTATDGLDDLAIGAAVEKVFDLTPDGIIRDLDLRRPIYQATAAHGHFGRDGFPWETTDRVEPLKMAVGASTSA